MLSVFRYIYSCFPQLVVTFVIVYYFKSVNLYVMQLEKYEIARDVVLSGLQVDPFR